MLCLFQLQNWEILPNDKPVLSAYILASGQEWFLANVNKELIQNIIKVKQQLHKNTNNDPFVSSKFRFLK